MLRRRPCACAALCTSTPRPARRTPPRRWVGGSGRVWVGGMAAFVLSCRLQRGLLRKRCTARGCTTLVTMHLHSLLYEKPVGSPVLLGPSAGCSAGAVHLRQWVPSLASRPGQLPPHAHPASHLPPPTQQGICSNFLCDAKPGQEITMTGACSSDLLFLNIGCQPSVCLHWGPDVGKQRLGALRCCVLVQPLKSKPPRSAGPTGKVPLRTRLRAALQSHTHLHAFLPGALQAPPARCCCCLRTPTP